MTETLIAVVLEVSVKGSVLLLAAWLAAALMARRSAAERHRVWVLAVAGVLALPLLSAVAPRYALPIAATAATDGAGGSPEVARQRAAAQAAENPAGESPRSASPPDTHGAAASSWLERIGLGQPGSGPSGIDPSGIGPRGFGLTGLGSMLLGIWLFVGTGIAWRFAAAGRRVRRHLRSLEPLDDGLLLQRIEVLRAELGIRRRIDVLGSEHDRSPWTWGVVRPALVLPACFAGWSAPAQRQALIHELAHIARRDHLVAWLAQLCCALHWFNPLVWLAAAGIRLESEQACDDRVLANGAAAPEYAEQLLQIASGAFGERRHSVWIPAMAHRSSLSPRVHSILDPNKRRTSMNRFKSTAFACAALAIAIPLATLDAQAPQAQETSAPQAALDVNGAEFRQLVAQGPDGSAELERIVEAYAAADRQAEAADAIARFLLGEYGTADVQGCDYCAVILATEGTPRQHAQFPVMVAAFDLIEGRAEASGSGDPLIQAVFNSAVRSGNRRAISRASYYVMRAIQIGIEESTSFSVAQFLHEQGNVADALELAQRLFEDQSSSHYQSANVAQWVKYLESEVRRRENLTSMIVDSLGYSEAGGEGEYLPIIKTPPVYPAAALEQRLEGYVVVEFTVDTTGKPFGVTVVESSAAVFNDSAVAAAQRFRYAPRMVAGSPVAVPGVRNRLAYRLE